METKRTFPFRDKMEFVYLPTQYRCKTALMEHTVDFSDHKSKIAVQYINVLLFMLFFPLSWEVLEFVTRSNQYIILTLISFVKNYWFVKNYNLSRNMNYTVALGNTIFITYFMEGAIDTPESLLGNYLPKLECVFLLQCLDFCIESKTCRLCM